MIFICFGASNYKTMQLDGLVHYTHSIAKLVILSGKNLSEREGGERVGWEVGEIEGMGAEGRIGRVRRLERRRKGWGEGGREG